MRNSGLSFLKDIVNSNIKMLNEYAQFEEILSQDGLCLGRICSFENKSLESRSSRTICIALKKNYYEKTKNIFVRTLNTQK